MNEYYIPSIVRNHLACIGVLIIDIKKELPLVVDLEQIQFIEVDFIEIGLESLSLWKANEVGLTYFLQFHIAEGKRLLREIKKEIKRVPRILEGPEEKNFRKLLYRTIKLGLEDLIATLNSLETGEGILIEI